jgi:hypothetical protein
MHDLIKYKFDPYLVKDSQKLDDYHSVPLSYLKPVDYPAYAGVVVYEMPYCMYSDYSGSTVERSNTEYMLRNFTREQGIIEVYSGYGTRGVMLTSSALELEEIKDIIEGLDNYPVISDDDMQQLENEIEFESWDSWIKYDLTRALDDAGISYQDDDTLRDMFYQAAERANEYAVFEDAVSCWFDLDRIVERWLD